MDLLFVATYGVLEGPSPSVAGYRAGSDYPCTLVVLIHPYFH